MFKEIFSFEIKQRLKRPSFYIFTFAILLMAFGAIASDDIQVGFSGGNDFKNSPFNIMNILLTMSTIAVFITTAIMSNAIIRIWTPPFMECFTQNQFRNFRIWSGVSAALL